MRVGIWSVDRIVYRILSFIILFYISMWAKPSGVIEPLNTEVAELFEIKTFCVSGNGKKKAKEFMSNSLCGEVEQLDSIKELQHRWFQIHIALPKIKSDTQSVFYTLDGNAFFPMILNLVSADIDMYDKLPLIVAIGHDSPLAFDRVLRSYDYLPSVPRDSILTQRVDETGGADQFLDFITSQVLPFIAEQYGTPKKQLLFGHSFGGVFVLNTLFNQKGGFTHYASASPSLWIDKGQLIKNNVRNSTEYLNAKLFLTYGSLERHTQKTTQANQVFQAQDLDIDEIVEMLKIQIPNGVNYQEFANQTHGSSIPYALKWSLYEFMKQD